MAIPVASPDQPLVLQPMQEEEKMPAQDSPVSSQKPSINSIPMSKLDIHAQAAKRPISFQGFTDISTAKQIRALFLKSATFQLRQRRTNCCLVLFLVALVVISIPVGLLVPDDAGGRTVPECPADNGRNQCRCAGTNTIWDDMSFCDKQTFIATWVNEQCDSPSPGGCDQQRSRCVSNSSASECTQHKVTGRANNINFNDDWFPWAKPISNPQLGCNAGSGLRETRVWVSSAKDLEVSFGDYNLFGLAKGEAFGKFSISDVIPDVYGERWLSITAVDDVSSAVKTSQLHVSDKRAPPSNGQCSRSSCYYEDIQQMMFMPDSASALMEYKRLFPDYGLHIDKSNPAKLQLHYQVHSFAKYGRSGETYELATIYSPSSSGGSSMSCNVLGPEADLFISNYNSNYNSGDGEEKGVVSLSLLISAMSRSLLYTANDQTLGSIDSKVVPMPTPTYVQGPGLFERLSVVLGTILLPLATLLIFPSFVQMVTAERISKVLVMMEMQGLNKSLYWLSTLLWQMFMYCLFTGFFVGLNVVVGSAAYTGADAAGLVVLLVVWGFTLAMMGLLLTSLFSKQSGAVIASYILVSVQINVSSLLGAIFNDTVWPLELDLIPFASFTHALLLAFNNLPSRRGEMWTAIGMLAAETVVLMLLAILAGTGSVRGFTRICSKISSCCRRRSPSLGVGAHQTSLLSEEERQGVEESEDVDVRAERKRVDAMEQSPAILLKNLVKTYPSRRGGAPKQAVKNLTLGIDYDECFGLLGPNGAGKTTTLHMLSGYIPPSDGQATICGHDIESELSEVHKVLSMCPQFDWVWEDLTVEEHLLLYARLKGATLEAETACMQRIAEAVELDGDSLRTLASQLSGGQRRRLSLGIALCGNPKVMFLDEPTTGLDPETRQQVWQMINRSKQGRCIVLTTHSMEEADALCERLGIMADGQLQCLGSQLHLKNRFGSGYQLKLTLQDDFNSQQNLADVDAFVERMMIDGAKPSLTENMNRTRTYSLPKHGTSISNIFSAMEENRARYGIREWGITMTTLDEVFMRIVQAAEQKAGEDAHDNETHI